MEFASLNVWALIVSMVASMALGFVWYSPQVFGTAWAKGLGKKLSDIDGSSAGPAFAVMIVGAIVTAAVLSYVLDWAGVATYGQAALVALLMWLGFTGASVLGNMMFRRSSISLFLIEGGYNLVQYVLIALILFAWM